VNSSPWQIGPYIVLEKIGQGGMSEIFRAREEKSGVVVALKTLRLDEEIYQDSIRQEIRYLASIRHPGIVRILAEGVENGSPWYAMEFLEGPTLRRHYVTQTSRAGTISVAEEVQDTHVQSSDFHSPDKSRMRKDERVDVDGGARNFVEEITPLLDIFQKLCIPLAYLHGEGLVHRDLKPDNIILAQGDVPILVDVGISTW